MMRRLVLHFFVAAVSHLIIGFAFFVRPLWVQWDNEHPRCRMHRGRPICNSSVSSVSSGRFDNSDQQSDDSEGTQTKRILWIIPNYRAVSASL